MSEKNGQEPFMTVREMVAEIRQDLKELKETVPSKATQADHERRIRGLEQWRYAVPPSLLIAIVSAATVVFTR